MHNQPRLDHRQGARPRRADEGARVGGDDVCDRVGGAFHFVLQFARRHAGEIVDIPFAKVLHHRCPLGKGNDGGDPFAQRAERGRRASVAGVEHDG